MPTKKVKQKTEFFFIYLLLRFLGNGWKGKGYELIVVNISGIRFCFNFLRNCSFLFVNIFQKYFTSDTFSKESLDKITLYLGFTREHKGYVRRGYFESSLLTIASWDYLFIYEIYA